MYPRISDFINDVFGTHFEWPIMSYGFFLAMAFLLGAFVLNAGLKRKEKQGLIHAKTITAIPGKINRIEFVLNLLIGFLVAHKLSFILLNFGLFREEPQLVLFSLKGYWLFGILGAAGMAYSYLRQQKKQSKKPKTRDVHPHQHTPTLVLIAAVSGIIGAKIFHQLENWDAFLEDPIEELLSFDGLTFYGGLISAAFFVGWFGEKQKIHWRHLSDAVAPALILAYGIGRIGCQVSGDGDWGIVNTAPMPEWLSFLPHWVWAYDYPNNVLGAGIPIPGCEGPYCFRLAETVFPTPIYETGMSLVIFGILLFLRKTIRIPGQLFAVYLFLNGLERGLIEQIRVNNLMAFFGMKITQAQLISTILIGIGLALFFYFQFVSPQIKRRHD